MGGLAALFLDRGAPVDRDLFHRLCTAVPCRSADGMHVWHGDAASLARLRLVTSDEDDAIAVDNDRSLVVAFDGRLDNRDELLALLNSDPAAADARLALEAVAKWDVDAPAHLVGDFAFVAWDPVRRRVLLARDHMGIRPLHYAVSPGRVICATDIAGVLAHPSVTRQPNQEVVAQYLACDIANGAQTLYQGIWRVPPAHIVAIHSGVARLHRYWSAEPKRRILYQSDDEYAAHCRDLLVRSVAARMRSPSPIAATLSGGVDSSSVALVAHLLVPGSHRPPLFSMVFPDRPDADEREYIDAVARQCGVTPVLVPPAAPTRSVAQRAAAWMDVPSMAADVMAEGLWSAMHARGYRVALTGAGGDFAYAGSIFHYADLIRSGRLLTLMRRYRDNSRAHDTGQSPVAWLQAGLWPALPLPVKRVLRPLASGMAARAGMARRPSWLRLPVEAERFPEKPRGGSFAVEDLVRSLTGGLHSFFLDGSARAAAEAGMELRHPLLDVRLTEFILAIPEEQRRRGPILKYVLRRALKHELPDVVAARTTKGDFAHCVWEAVESIGGEAFFRSLALANAGWVDGDRVLRLYSRMRDEVPLGPAHYGRHIPEIWMIIAIELWFRSAFGGIMAAPWTNAQTHRHATMPLANRGAAVRMPPQN